MSLHEVRGWLERPEHRLRLESCDPGLQRVVLRHAFQVRRGEPRVVDAHQRLVLADDLAGLDEDLGHDAAFEVLHDLDLARGNHLAHAHGDLVERREAGPEERDEEESDRAPQDPVGLRAGALQGRCTELRHELGVVHARPQRLACAREQGPFDSVRVDVDGTAG